MKSDLPQVKKREPHFSHFGIGSDRDFFIENLATLVHSGMSIRDALATIGEDVKSSAMKKILVFVREEVDAGSTLSDALAKTGLFQDHVISLVRVGEESGKLSENLKVVSLEESKNRAFRSKIRSAMMYPAFVLGLAAVIGVGISWFILPKLAHIFSQLNLKLPFLTRVLIGTGDFLEAHGAIAVPAAIIFIILLFYFLFAFKKTKVAGQYILFRIPAIKRLIREIELSRFGYLLGTLLAAGLPVTEALRCLRDATTFPHYKKLYTHVMESITDGNSFRASFVSYKHLSRLMPASVQQLVTTSEQSGTLSQTLIEIGKTYEEKTETTTKDLSVILEPVLLVIVWLGVVGLALAVILPIYSLIGGLSPS